MEPITIAFGQYDKIYYSSLFSSQRQFEWGLIANSKSIVFYSLFRKILSLERLYEAVKDIPKLIATLQ